MSIEKIEEVIRELDAAFTAYTDAVYIANYTARSVHVTADVANAIAVDVANKKETCVKIMNYGISLLEEEETK